MNERELTQRLWVSSRFSWAMKLLLIGIPLSWVVLIDSKSPSPGILFDYSDTGLSEGWLWGYVIVSFYWLMPNLYSLPAFLRCRTVKIAGDFVIATDWKGHQHFLPIDENLHLARQKQLIGWAPFDEDDAEYARSGGYTSPPWAWPFRLLAEILPRWERSLYTLRYSQFRHGGVEVWFYPPARRLGSGAPFQFGMQFLMQLLEAVRQDERKA